MRFWLSARSSRDINYARKCKLLQVCMPVCSACMQMCAVLTLTFQAWNCRQLLRCESSVPAAHAEHVRGVDGPQHHTYQNFAVLQLSWHVLGYNFDACRRVFVIVFADDGRELLAHDAAIAQARQHDRQEANWFAKVKPRTQRRRRSMFYSESHVAMTIYMESRAVYERAWWDRK